MNKIFSLSIALLLAVSFSSCGGAIHTNNGYLVSSEDINPAAEQHQKMVDSIFIAGYRLYENFEYKQALPVFEELIIRDTSLLQYESYAFAADCYAQQQRSAKGLQVYDSLIHRFRARLKNDPDSYDLNVSLEESIYMKSQYPSLPFFLTKEQGFIPYDSVPRVLENRAPVFPEYARREGMQGDVLVKARLSGSGKIEKVRVLESRHSAFTQSVMDVLPFWKFSPYKRKGRLSKVEVTIPFRFRLRN